MPLGLWSRKVMGSARGLMTPTLSPVAVDFGAGALKVLQVMCGEPPTLVAAACLPTPDELMGDVRRRLAYQAETLPALLRDLDVRGRRAVCAIPAVATFTKHMQLAPEGGTSLVEAARLATATQAGCDPAAMVFRHVEVGPVPRAGRTEVICLAAPRDMVEMLMQALRACRLDPVGMHVEYLAALRAFDRMTRRAEDRALTTLYLDIGASATRVMIAHGRDLVFARTVEIGGWHLDQAVARRLGLDLRQARAHRLATVTSPSRIRSSSGADAHGRQGAPPQVPTAPGPALRDGVATPGHDGSGPHSPRSAERRSGHPAPGLGPDLTAHPTVPLGPADLAETLETLTDEIAMCLRYHEALFPERRVQRAIFFGGEARHVGLCQHVARTLRLSAQVADPMSAVAHEGHEPTVGVDFRQPQPGWTMTLGLCLAPTDL